MALRTGVYIVPTNRWYIERTVWLIAGVVLLASTALALLINLLWIIGVLATGLISINVAFTAFCPIGSALNLLGFTPMFGSGKPARWNLYFMQTDQWYLERRIPVTVSRWIGSVNNFPERSSQCSSGIIGTHLPCQ